MPNTCICKALAYDKLRRTWPVRSLGTARYGSLSTYTVDSRYLEYGNIKVPAYVKVKFDANLVRFSLHYLQFNSCNLKSWLIQTENSGPFDFEAIRVYCTLIWSKYLYEYVEQI